MFLLITAHHGRNARKHHAAEAQCHRGVTNLLWKHASKGEFRTYEGESVAEIRQAFKDSVDDYLEHCANTGKEPNKPYSGKFMLRLDPALHASLAAKAIASGKSLNQYAAEVLAHA